VGLYPTQFVVGTRWDAFFRYRNLLHRKDLFLTLSSLINKAFGANPECMSSGWF